MPENIEKTYELRNLEADDLFIVINIINKIGIKEFKACFESEEVKSAVLNMAGIYIAFVSIGVSVAFDIAAILLANIGKCKNDIYALLAHLSGTKEKEIAKLPVKTFTSMVVDLVQKEEFTDFFQDVVKLFK